MSPWIVTFLLLAFNRSAVADHGVPTPEQLSHCLSLLDLGVQRRIPVVIEGHTRLIALLLDAPVGSSRRLIYTAVSDDEIRNKRPVPRGIDGFNFVDLTEAQYADYVGGRREIGTLNVEFNTETRVRRYELPRFGLKPGTFIRIDGVYYAVIHNGRGYMALFNDDYVLAVFKHYPRSPRTSRHFTTLKRQSSAWFLADKEISPSEIGVLGLAELTKSVRVPVSAERIDATAAAPTEVHFEGWLEPYNPHPFTHYSVKLSGFEPR